MDEGQDTEHGPSGPSTPGPGDKYEPSGEYEPAEPSDEYVSQEDYKIILLEQNIGLLEANVEASMRVYDMMVALLAEVSGSMVLSNNLIEQHKEGKYYFPPFFLGGRGDTGEEDE